MEWIGVVAALACLVWGVYFLRDQTLVRLVVLTTMAGSVFWQPFFKVSAGPIPLTVDRGLWAATMAWFAWEWYRGKLPPLRIHTVDFMLAGLVGLIAINLALTDWEFNEKLPFTTYLFDFIMPFGLYIVCRSYDWKSRDFNVFTVAMGVFAIYLTVTGIGETIGPTSIVFPKYILSEEFQEFLGRARGPFLNPIANGMILATCMACAAVWWPQVGRIGKVIVLGVMGCCLAAIFLTYTRSVWISGCFGFLICAWYYSPPRLRVVLVCWGVIMGSTVLYIAKDSLNSFKRDKYVSVEDMSESALARPMLAAVAMEMAQDAPLFGVGFGQYNKHKDPYHYRDYDGLAVQSVKVYVQHSAFLAMLVELGIIGLIVYFSFCLNSAVAAIRQLLNPEVDDWGKRMSLVYLVILQAIVINGLFHDVTIEPMVNIFWFTVLGIAASKFPNVQIWHATDGHAMNSRSLASPSA